MKKIGYVGSIMLIFCVDYNRVIDAAEYLGFRYKQGVPIVDFITAAITAKSLGIDSFFSNCMHRGNINRIYNLLNLPEKYCFPLITLILGYSDEKNDYKKEYNNQYNQVEKMLIKTGFLSV